ncbi:prepilin-type N-terminal cleavage/methylation domain-containing protein [Candidatus Gracilibacteria bacterium]|nr:prepilin-type N-terminal cleavage/methylation domain-containing protein [Candidatus Gracilibacteria bacterium]
MKKNIIAFTMIELIVVISIISIISVSSLNGFFNFLDDSQIKTKASEIILTIENLDKKIKNYEIYDYSIIFKSSYKDSYLVKQNIFDSDKYVYGEYNYINKELLLNINNLGGDAWIIKNYKDVKLEKQLTLATSNIDIKIDDGYNYKFESYSSGTTKINRLNDIELIKIDKNDNLIFIDKITQSIGGLDLGEIEIKNIGGKKQFYNSGTLLNINEIYLNFESKGRENYIKITK